MAASAAASSSFAQANMMADLQLLSVGAAEASPTCLVITDRDRCVFVVYVYVCDARVIYTCLSVGLLIYDIGSVGFVFHWDPHPRIRH